MTLAVTTDRTLFRQTIVTWLFTYAGVADAARIIWGNQAVPRPTKPYGTILFPSGAIKTGFDDTRAQYNGTTQAIERTTSGPRQITAQVEVFSDPASSANALEARELLENALLALDSVAVRDLFRAAKIGVLGHTPVIPFDEQFGERWERRAQSDVTFMYSGETFDDGGGGTGNWIETVQIPADGITATYNQ